MPVAKNALLLGKKLDADLSVIEVAAYLHDIGRAGPRKQYRAENDHHVTGAREGRDILQGLGCDNEFVDKVEHCIFTHRGRKGPKPESMEAEIVACADAMAHFDTFLDMFAFFLVNNPLENAIIGIEKKTQRNWENKLTLPEAKEIAREKYDAVMLLLNSMKECMNRKN